MKRYALAVLIIILAMITVLSGCSGSDGNSQTTVSNETVTEKAKEITVSYIDVGKGDCILIEQGTNTMLIDTGYYETVSDVESYLAKKGIDKLDYLVISHYDKDHVGGASEIIKDYSPSMVYLPNYTGSSEYYSAMVQSLTDNNIKSSIVSEDTSFTLGDAQMYIYKSDIEYEEETESKEGNDNDVSLVISCIYMEDSYLFPGDIEKKGINSFLEKDAGNFDVLKMPHHGRYNKNTEDLITAISPKYAVITDSAEDPADEDTLTLLSDAGAEIYSTSSDKTIEIKSNGSREYTVTTNM